jgi:transcription initiation factor TFIID subunit 6
LLIFRDFDLSFDSASSPHMSLFPKESVNLIAESLGLTLKDEVSAALVQDVEYRLRQVLLEAKKFKTHARRSKLLVSDVNAALKVKNVEPIFGYNSWNRNTWKQTAFNDQQLHYVEV